MKLRTASFALVSVLAAAVAAACTNETIYAPAPVTVTDAAASSPDKSDAGMVAAEPAKMSPIVASALGADLKAAGLDVQHLPTIAELKKDKTKLVAVMKSFKTSLGVECTGCHAPNPDGGRPDFEAPTPEKRVAAKMWDTFVGQMTMADGALLYCDSCHQGKKEFIDRDHEEGVATWMKENFIANLKRKDGAPQTCSNCHGKPFDPDFLAKWETGAN